MQPREFITLLGGAISAIGTFRTSSDVCYSVAMG